MYANQRTIRRGMTVLTAMVLAFLASQTSRAEEKPTVPSKPVFFVSGGPCSRMWSLIGTYETANAAIKAAEKYKAETKYHVQVSTGVGGFESIMKSPVSYSIYRQGIRCGNWFLHSTVESQQKVDEILKRMDKPFQPLELVLHYAPTKL